MITLKDLTPEIKEKIEVYKKDIVENLYNGNEYKDYNRQDTVDYIEYIYALCKRQKPVVVVANTIKEYKKYFNALFNSDKLNDKVLAAWDKINDAKNPQVLGDEIEKAIQKLKPKDITEGEVKSHYLFLASEYSRVYLMWYMFIHKELKVPTKKSEELHWLFDHVKKANIAKGFFNEKIVLILRMPEKIRRNEVGLHDISSEGAIQYPDQKLFYINGRKIPDWVFDKYFAKTLTFEDFVKEDNEDVKAGIMTLIKENEGNEGILKFLKAEMVDEKQLVHQNGYVETVRLYKTKEKYSFLRDRHGNSDVPYAWTEMVCPSTGQVYLIDTSSDFTDVLESVKFHRPKHVPVEVPYIWESAN